MALYRPVHGDVRTPAFSAEAKMMGYTAGIATGTNTYLEALLCPLADVHTHIPDTDLSQRVPKRINYNTTVASNLPSPTGQPTTGDLLLHFTPQGKFTVCSISVNVGTTASPQWMYAAEIKPDQVLAENYSQSRYANSYMEVVSSTVSSGAFALSGQIWATNYQDPPFYYNMSAQALLASRKDESSYLENGSVMVGATVIGDPTLDMRFTPSDTAFINNSGTEFKVVYSTNALAGTNPAGPRTASNIQNTGFWPMTGGAEPASYVIASTGIAATPLWAAVNSGAKNASFQMPAAAPGPNFNPYHLSAQPSYTLPAVLRGDLSVTATVTFDALTNIPAGTTEGLSLNIGILTWDGYYTTQRVNSLVSSASGNLAMLNNTVSVQGYFSSKAPVAGIFLTMDNNSGTPGYSIAPGNATSISVEVRNTDFYRPGEVSNGSFVVVTGLPDPASDATPQILSINSLVNYEGVPNANLALNVRTTLPVMDLIEDIEAAKLVLSNKSMFGIRSVYESVDYRNKMHAGFFKALANRNRIRETGVTFSLGDMWGGIKSGLRGALSIATPFAQAANPQYANLIGLGSGMAQRGLTGAYRGMTAPSASVCGGSDTTAGGFNLPFSRDYSGSGETASFGVVPYGRVAMESAPAEASDTSRSNLVSEEPTPATTADGRMILYCAPGDDVMNAFLATLTAEQRAAYDVALASRPAAAGPAAAAAGPRPKVGAGIYADEDPEWVTLIGSTRQRKIAELRYIAKQERKPTPSFAFVTQRIPVAMSDSEGAVVKFVMTAKPFQYIPDVNHVRAERAAYIRLTSGATGQLNVHLEVNQYRDPKDHTALVDTCKFIDMAGDVYLTVNRINVSLSGNSFCMGAYALIAGLPDVAPMSGGTLYNPAPQIPGFAMFMPVGKQLVKLQAALEEPTAGLLSVGKHLICAGGEVVDGMSTAASMVAQLTNPFALPLIPVNTPGDLAYLCASRAQLAQEKEKIKAQEAEVSGGVRPPKHNAEFNRDNPPELAAEFREKLDELQDLTGHLPRLESALANWRNTLKNIEQFAGKKISESMLVRWQNGLIGLKTTIDNNTGDKASKKKKSGTAHLQAPKNPKMIAKRAREAAVKGGVVQPQEQSAAKRQRAQGPAAQGAEDSGMEMEDNFD